MLANRRNRIAKHFVSLLLGNTVRFGNSVARWRSVTMSAFTGFAAALGAAAACVFVILVPSRPLPSFLRILELLHDCTMLPTYEDNFDVVP